MNKVIIYTMSHLPLVLFGCLPKNVQKLEIGYALFCIIIPPLNSCDGSGVWG